MVSLKRVKRSEKIKVMKILKALNYIYSLRYLESLLSIPYQNLWKYINMLTIPSDEVTANMLSKLSDLKLIDKTINDLTNNYKNDIRKLASDIGFLFLYLLKIEDILKNLDIRVVLPISEDSIPFATILAWELGSKLCLPLFNTKVRDPKIKIVWYYSFNNNEVELLFFPRSCIEESSVLLVDITLNDIEKLKAITQLLKSDDINIEGVVTVYIDRECLEFTYRTITPQVLYITVI